MLLGKFPTVKQHLRIAAFRRQSCHDTVLDIVPNSFRMI